MTEERQSFGRQRESMKQPEPPQHEEKGEKEKEPKPAPAGHVGAALDDKAAEEQKKQPWDQDRGWERPTEDPPKPGKMDDKVKKAIEKYIKAKTELAEPGALSADVSKAMQVSGMSADTLIVLVAGG